ncbi:hypothetical protein HaLaN_29885, partial [Haematococcus lacustris]
YAVAVVQLPVCAELEKEGKDGRAFVAPATPSGDEVQGEMAAAEDRANAKLNATKRKRRQYGEASLQLGAALEPLSSSQSWATASLLMAAWTSCEQLGALRALSLL